MHDRDEFRSEPGLHVTGDVFNGGGDGILSSERGVYNDTESFHLEIGLVQGLEGTAIVEVMIEWDGKVGICDGGD